MMSMRHMRVHEPGCLARFLSVKMAWNEIRCESSSTGHAFHTLVAYNDKYQDGE